MSKQSIRQLFLDASEEIGRIIASIQGVNGLDLPPIKEKALARAKDVLTSAFTAAEIASSELTRCTVMRELRELANRMAEEFVEETAEE